MLLTSGSRIRLFDPVDVISLTLGLTVAVPSVEDGYSPEQSLRQCSIQNMLIVDTVIISSYITAWTHEKLYDVRYAPAAMQWINRKAIS